MLNLVDPSGQRVLPVGEAFELIAVVECFKTKWAELDPTLPILDSTLVALADLARNPRALAAYLAAERGEALEGYGPDQPYVTAIDGGCLLTSQLSAPMSPSCCGDLDDIGGSWVDLAVLESPEWTEFRTGHPGLLARREGEVILVTDCHEPDSPRIPTQPILRLSAAALKLKVDAVLEDLERAVPAFAEAVTELVAAAPYRTAAARALLGLEVDMTGWWPDET